MYQAHPLDERLASVLPAGSLFAVGGRVRDELRAQNEPVAAAKDLDYVVVGVALDELRARLSALGRVDLVGASFAVIKLTVDGHTVDSACRLVRRGVLVPPGEPDVRVVFPLFEHEGTRADRCRLRVGPLHGHRIEDVQILEKVEHRRP